MSVAMATGVLGFFTLGLVGELDFFRQLDTLHLFELNFCIIRCLIEVKFGLRSAVALKLSDSLLVFFEDLQTVSHLFSVSVVLVIFTGEFEEFCIFWSQFLG